jgi:hypothetical protein
VATTAQTTVRALCCCLLLALVAGCGGTNTVTVTKTVTVDATAKQGIGAPLETVQFGHIKSLKKKGAAYELRFDPALFLSGETANVAAAEDGAVPAGEPVPNDNYVVDEGHRLLTYRVPADAKVTVLTKGPEGTPITVAELARIVAGDHAPLWEALDTGFWLRTRIDTVRSLDQQYHP